MTFLSGVRALLLEQGLGKARTGILSKQLTNHGGTVVKSLYESTTHVLVGNIVKYARVLTLLKVDTIPENISVLRADWLSSCLVKKEIVSEEEYRLLPASTATYSSTTTTVSSPKQELSPRPTTSSSSGAVSSNTTTKVEERGGDSLVSPKAGMFGVACRRWKSSSSPVKARINRQDSSDSDYVESEEEEEEEVGEGERERLEAGVEDRNSATAAESDDPPPTKRKKWICELSSSKAQTWENHNKHITDTLQELLTVYQNAGEKWRVMSTTKAIQALKKHPKEITTFEEARSVPFVGERLAEKIYEIVSSGRLRRLENVDREKEKAIETFRNIHGVGQITAQQFYAQGHRTIEELKNANILTKVQLIGVKHYNEFLERMQREEVAEIEAKVKEIAHSIDKGLEVVTCGSYRRGKLTCGDIDILITHPDGRSHRGMMGVILERGHQDGFFTDDLSVHNEPKGPGKYLGVCKLEGEGRKHRRIDIMVVPYCEFPLALLHFTGSGHMNRSMRSKADKMGMSLSEHALCTGVIRKNGAKLFEGTPLPVTCEKDVFKYLNLEYKDPIDRDWD